MRNGFYVCAMGSDQIVCAMISDQKVCATVSNQNSCMHMGLRSKYICAMVSVKTYLYSAIDIKLRGDSFG